MVRQLVRAPIELPIGQLLPFEHHGGRIRGAGHLRLEQHVQRIQLARCGLCLPVGHQSLSLGLREDGSVQDGAVGIAGELLEQGSVVPEHARDSILVEEIGVVLGKHPQLAAAAEAEEAQVRARDPVFQFERLEDHRTHLEVLARVLVQDEHRLEQRCVAQVALGL